ncbi:MAG TPA: carbamoyl-phosphate synthase (glutamine-hydrolyzing) large subunit [Candidatus Peribacterales bacterium]|nr:carbamoyl-phosphate synthase (glutamine-hydrolyzing) large subunit [Candidatus Peribacterales bacterium]
MNLAQDGTGSHQAHEAGGGSFSTIQTILLLGSGALKIGEAGEFDYSGSQAIKAFKEEGKRVVLVNPNIATNQTSWNLADEVYFYPVTVPFVTKIIAREKPDAIALSFGGQTALNCGVALHDEGVLSAHGIQVLGTPVESIRKTEDRALFNQELQSIDVSVPRSIACDSKDEAMRAAVTIGFPLIVRAAFALGGKGSGRAMNADELTEILDNAFVESPQVLVEEDLTGWKEIEYEVVRDQFGNTITVCNMENVDPLGIHTGESIVVAPSQTLDNTEYQMLRTIAQKVVTHLGIIGECNIQYALDPKSRAYRVIEVNARLSRSSALASKATGYPLAFVAAKLALGYALPSLRNAITEVTCADFEPALDYVAVKVPRWDLQKFHHVSDIVTSEMKSVGEVMALGRTFEEALQKALRMINVGAEGLLPTPMQFTDVSREVRKPTPRRIFAIAQALRDGVLSVEEISLMTGIDRWFLQKIQDCTSIAGEMLRTKADPLDKELLQRAKKHGFSDRAIAEFRGVREEQVRSDRLSFGMKPMIRQIDTLAAEFPAKTNYLYMTYHGTGDDISFQGIQSRPRAIVLGGGPYSIGSSVEFDWCCVECVRELSRQGYEVAMINSNPETVSTDYDECDALFFDELSQERVLDIIDALSPKGVVVSMGGQIPNSLARKLAAANVPILGTAPENIDRAEDRHKFSSLLDTLKIDQPEWKEFTDLTAAERFASDCGYPVIVRPSYVLSGAAMAVVHSGEALEGYLAQAALVSREAPVVVSKFEQGAKEIEFDAVAQNGELLLYAVGEHVENAGVHSGDATIVLPPQRVNMETLNRIKVIAKEIAKALQISGPFNLQLLAKDNRIKVIECNLRASRSFPFASKVTNINFVELATKALLGKAPTGIRYQTIDLDHVGVKAAQFSFARLKGADPRLGVEMASTGEVGCFGRTAAEAFLCSLLSVGFRLPRKPEKRPGSPVRTGGTILVTVGSLEDKAELAPTFLQLHEMGFALAATERTHAFLESRGIPSMLLYKISEPRGPNIREYLAEKRLDLVINIPQHFTGTEITDGYKIRRLAIDRGIPLLTNVQLVKRLVEAMEAVTVDEIPVTSWREFIGN